MRQATSLRAQVWGEQDRERAKQAAAQMEGNVVCRTYSPGCKLHWQMHSLGTFPVLFLKKGRPLKWELHGRLVELGWVGQSIA